MKRPGLDPEVIVAIQGVDNLIKGMRNGVLYSSAPENEDDAVKRYLLYISMLFDIVLPDIVMSAIAGHDHMIEMKQRILLEYAAKAAYFIETQHRARRRRHGSRHPRNHRDGRRYGRLTGRQFFPTLVQGWSRSVCTSETWVATATRRMKSGKTHNEGRETGDA